MCCNDYYIYETISSISVYTFTASFVAMCLLLFKVSLRCHWSTSHHCISHLCLLSHLVPPKIEKKKKKKRKKEKGAGGTKVRWEAPASPLMWYKIAAEVQQERGQCSQLHPSQLKYPCQEEPTVPGTYTRQISWHKLTVPERVAGTDPGLKKRKRMAGTLYWYISIFVKVRNLKLCQCKLDIKISMGGDMQLLSTWQPRAWGASLANLWINALVQNPTLNTKHLAPDKNIITSACCYTKMTFAFNYWLFP